LGICLFFQAEDGIRDRDVTGVQTCALPILFRRSCPELEFIPKDMPVESLTYDNYILSGNLGSYFSISKEDFSSHPKQYLISNQDLKNKLIKKIKSSSEFICGVAWKSKNVDVGQDKSLSIDKFLPIFNIPNINFIDLQYGDTEAERQHVLDEYKIEIKKIDEIDNFNDIDCLASLIDVCDFIVTTSNVTAHIAGALGKEVYLILPFSRGKIWYWHKGDEVSLWYPSIKQFSTPKEGPEIIMKEIAEKIKERISD